MKFVQYKIIYIYMIRKVLEGVAVVIKFLQSRTTGNLILKPKASYCFCQALDFLNSKCL